MKSGIHFSVFTKDQVQEWVPQIANLRIEVFKEYPFLYDGDLAYEKKYLKKFTKMKNAIVVVAFDGDEVIGVSTGYPFTYETNLTQVFEKKGLDPQEYFCFGESVLRKSYRGQGIGKKFLEERETFVRKLQEYPYICFYTSTRPKTDPKKPKDYRPLTPLWTKYGFVEHPELIGHVSYQEIGEEKESKKEMVFWIKKL